MLSAICCLLVLPLALAGFRDTRVHIVGGRAADPCEFPSIVHLIIDGMYSCGGTLIDNRHVLTAAHCLGTGFFTDVQVNIGTNQNDRAGQFVISSKKVNVHRDYTDYTRNDIAIVELSSSVKFSKCVQPATLARAGQTFDNKTCIAAGWGRLGFNLRSTTILQKVSMPIIPHGDCMQRMAYANLNNQHICAGDFENGGASTCYGDSGGPLYCPGSDGRLVLAGITSFGYECAKDAAIFTNVATFRGWIVKNIKKPNKDTREHIVAGNPAGTCEFPSIVHLLIERSDGPFACGGTLIDNQHVLTAAHCFGTGVRSIQVSIGTNRIDRAGEFLIDALTVHVHEFFTNNPIRNDIAIVKLNRPVQFTTCVQPATLASPGQTFDRMNCIVAGWGTLDFHLPSTSVLQKVSMPIIQHNRCKRRMAYARLNNQHICAGDFISGGASTCMGDYGGPLYCPSNGGMVLAGITSFGYDCSIDAAIFTSVATFRGWIDQKH